MHSFSDLDFLLHGAVQRVTDQIRVTARLMDMRADAQVIWSRRFDRSGADLLTLQDEIAAETVAQVDPELLLREGKLAVSRPPTNPTSYDFMLRAIPAIYRLDREGFLQAGTALSAAVALDPDYAAAQAWWAYWHVLAVGQGWASDPAGAIRDAARIAESAVALDPADARALTIAGHVRAFLGGSIDEALALHDRALAVNPNLPLAWVFSGLALSYAGRHAQGLERMRQAHRLSPADPHGFFFDMALMVPHLARGDDEIVVALGRKATTLNPMLSSTQKGYLSALGHLGRTEEQEVVRARLLALEPEFSVRTALERSPLRMPEDRERYIAGLRLAGLRET